MAHYFPNVTLSPFQEKAIQAIEAGDHVLVTAHTGSGKTLPAEFAILHAHQQKKKIIYASPIKALSNQKLYDMRVKFPQISFGLLTGDVRDNPGADVLIMTTEILRNTLFQKKIHASVQTPTVQTPTVQTPTGTVQTPTVPFEMDFDKELMAVVFDEVHYINDAERGAVWEQAILLMPPHVQLIMLSATLDKPEEFALWIETEKNKQAITLGLQPKQVHLAATSERSVPLTHYMWLSFNKSTLTNAKGPIEKKLHDAYHKPLQIGTSKGIFHDKNYSLMHELTEYLRKKQIYTKRQFVLQDLVHYLNKNEMLPAIAFVFSRKHAEQAAHEAGAVPPNPPGAQPPPGTGHDGTGAVPPNPPGAQPPPGTGQDGTGAVPPNPPGAEQPPLVSPSGVGGQSLLGTGQGAGAVPPNPPGAEKNPLVSPSGGGGQSPLRQSPRRECEHILRTKLPNYKEYLLLPEYLDIVALLEKGVAYHHAGVLPVLREMIELMFSKGFVKLLFATETFAVGINMPTKTVIFTGLTKYNGSVMRQLYPHEYTQMAGRAGRRGLDTVGHVIHCNNLFELPSQTDYKHMITGPPQKLTSKFKFSYNLILNVLAAALPSASAKSKTVIAFVGQSMLQKDIEKEVHYYTDKLKSLEGVWQQALDNTSEQKTPTDVLQHYRALEREGLNTRNAALRKIRTDMAAIRDAHPTLQQDLKIMDDVEDVQNTMEHHSTERSNALCFMEDMVSAMVDFMIERGFITPVPSSDQLLITLNGRIAAHFQEVHPLVMATVLHETNDLQEFSAIELGALFSIFNTIRVRDEIQSLKPATSSALVNTTAGRIKELLDEYQAYEERYRLDGGATYDANYELLPYVMRWCEATDEQECKIVIEELKHDKEVFLGEFLKALLKVNTIAQEIERVCELTQNIDLLAVVRKIPSLTLKYVVTSQSLYI